MMVEVDYHEMFIRLTYGKTYTGGQLVCYQFYFYLREMLIPSLHFYQINIRQVKSLIGLNQFQFQLRTKI